MFKGFSKAASDYSRAFKLFSELKLWKYTLVPVLVGLLVGAGIITLSYTLSDNIGAWLADFWLWDWGSDTVGAISNFLGGVVALVLGFMIYKHAVMAISAPFMAPISEKIETHLTGKEMEKQSARTFVTLLVRGIRINVRNLLMELLITIPLLILSIIPLLNLISGLAILYTQAFYAGFGNMDYTLERHRNYKDSIRFINKNKGTAAGNGIVFILFLMIPLVGISLALPFSCAAATISTVRRLESLPAKGS